MKLFKSIIRTVATFAVAVSMVTANVSAATVATVPLEHTEKMPHFLSTPQEAKR